MAKFTSLLYTMSQLSTRNGKTQYSRIHGNIHAVKRTFTSNRQTHEMIQVLQFIILGANFHFFSLSLSFFLILLLSFEHSLVWRTASPTILPKSLEIESRRRFTQNAYAASKIYRSKSGCY